MLSSEFLFSDIELCELLYRKDLGVFLIGVLFYCSLCLERFEILVQELCPRVCVKISDFANYF